MMNIDVGTCTVGCNIIIWWCFELIHYRQRWRMLCPSEAWVRCSSPYVGHEAHRWIGHQVCDAWSLANVMAHLLLPFQLQSITAAWLVGNCTAWWQRCMWTTCPELLLCSNPTASQTHDMPPSLSLELHLAISELWFGQEW